MRRLLSCLIGSALLLLLSLPQSAGAITAPELRGAKSMQDLSQDMHGRNLQEKEFLKMDLKGYNFSDADMRFVVFNATQLQEADLSGADLRDVVAFASRFDGANLSQARFTTACCCAVASAMHASMGPTSAMPCSISRNSRPCVSAPLV